MFIASSKMWTGDVFQSSICILLVCVPGPIFAAGAYFYGMERYKAINNFFSHDLPFGNSAVISGFFMWLPYNNFLTVIYFSNALLWLHLAGQLLKAEAATQLSSGSAWYMSILSASGYACVYCAMDLASSKLIGEAPLSQAASCTTVLHTLKSQACPEHVDQWHKNWLAWTVLWTPLQSFGTFLDFAEANPDVIRVCGLTYVVSIAERAKKAAARQRSQRSSYTALSDPDSDSDDASPEFKRFKEMGCDGDAWRQLLHRTMSSRTTDISN
eukprot:TRINITY_DN49103_c0_g1_i1.p1 TRINITY_DN49103_c0_g1~~TRINITY_DN49103_c0_g1_i1.p1  ORF type:complete len:289 (-),score=43.21 TRINITY_DN49103_c0_g1_i1:321-1130(-)